MDDLTEAQCKAILALAENEQRRVILGGGHGPRIIGETGFYQRLHPGTYGFLSVKRYIVTPTGVRYGEYILSPEGWKLAKQLGAKQL